MTTWFSKVGPSCQGLKMLRASGGEGGGGEGLGGLGEGGGGEGGRGLGGGGGTLLGRVQLRQRGGGKGASSARQQRISSIVPAAYGSLAGGLQHWCQQPGPEPKPRGLTAHGSRLRPHKRLKLQAHMLKAVPSTKSCSRAADDDVDAHAQQAVVLRGRWMGAGAECTAGCTAQDRSSMP